MQFWTFEELFSMGKKKVRKKKSQKKQGRSAAEVRSYCVVLKDKYGKQGPP